MQIFNFIGNIFGYVLWFFYWLTSNYGVAIILFTIAVKVLMFPMTIKQQKSMAANSGPAIPSERIIVVMKVSTERLPP